METLRISLPQETKVTEPENDVQRRLRAVLDYWGQNGEFHLVGPCNDYRAKCAVNVVWDLFPRDRISCLHYLREAAREMGFAKASACSDSGFENARKMVLRAITLSGDTQ